MTSSRSTFLQSRAETLKNIAGTKEVTDKDVETLISLACNIEKKAKEIDGPIYDLNEDALDSALFEARRFSSVRRGPDVHLPYWHENCSALPNCLLRSPFFSSSAGVADSSSANTASQEESTSTPRSFEYQKLRVTVTGETLGWFDRRVLAVCVDQYRETKPLSNGGEDSDDWIELSFFQLATRMGVQYSKSGHSAMSKSLHRLSTTSLMITSQSRSFKINQFIQVVFEKTDNEDEYRSKSRLKFRVLSCWANLYGHKMWTAVPHSVLDAGRGLKSWVVCFYSTHSKPHLLKVDRLRELSGSKQERGVFLTNLKKVLSELEKASLVVKSFEFDKTKKIRVGGNAPSVKVLTVKMT